MEAPSARPADVYIHGTVPEEQARLSMLNDLLNGPSLDALGLTGGERILDVGSGLGQFTRQMARAAGPGGYVLGIERDAAQREQAIQLAADAGEADLVTFRPGDATALPLTNDEQGTFDVVHTRFLLEHVTDPLAVVRQMVHAARPGGRIVLADDDHEVLRVWPEPPGLYDLWRAYYRVYDRLGNDPQVGRRLVSLLHEAGADPRRNTWIFFGSCSGEPRFRQFVENLIGVIDSARAAILAHAFFDETYFDETIASFRAWSQRPDAAIWYALSWAEGVKRAT